MLATLRNDFHNSRTTVRYRDGQPLSPRQIRRAARRLCGMAGCECSCLLGTRGEQEVDIDSDGNDTFVLRGLPEISP